MLPRSGIKIGRVFGIDIVINPTWLLIFALVGVSFGDTLRNTSWDGELFPGGALPWVVGLLCTLVFFACLLLHEIAHSYVAKRNGIPIGRITLFIFGGVAEMTRDVDSPGLEFRMAIAGPLVTFILAGIFYGFYRLASNVGASVVLIAPLFYLAWLNLFIGFFNLLPGFPMDGGRVLRSAIWKLTGNLRLSTRIASLAGQFFGLAMMGVGFYLFISSELLEIGALWLVFIGLFLLYLARASYKQTLIRLTTRDTRVSEIMYTDIPQVESGTPLTALQSNYFGRYSVSTLPVVEDGKLVGLVSREDLERVSPAEWDLLNAGRIARPVTEADTVGPDTPLEHAMIPLIKNVQKALIVVSDGEFVGILTRESLQRFVDMRMRSQGR